MRHRRIITSQVEGLWPFERTRGRLQEFERPELERYVHDIIGIGWRAIRQTRKNRLIQWIQEYWDAHPED